jgi:hypothetical protein
MASIVLSGREVKNMIDNSIDELEYMGYDTDNLDPELMGSIIKKIISKIKKVKRAKAKAAKQPDSESYSINTPYGTAKVGETGLSITKPVSDKEETAEDEGIIGMVKKNPVLLAIPAIALLLLLKK